MKLPVYQVDAFASHCFEGNPAAVCLLQQWIDDTLMQAIAAENNLSETAFFVPGEAAYELRWFTPTQEVDLCGHATLATAHVLFEELGYSGEMIEFDTRSGRLRVRRVAELLEMDFPAQPSVKCDAPDLLLQAFNLNQAECLNGEDYLLVLDDETAVMQANPDLSLLKQINLRAVIITAASSQYDFVNRVFGPKVGIDEDPVTGSAFTQLVPYWSERLGKHKLTAKQVSQRGGEVFLDYKDQRVMISGKAVTFLKGEIEI